MNVLWNETALPLSSAVEQVVGLFPVACDVCHPFSNLLDQLDTLMVPRSGRFDHHRIEYVGIRQMAVLTGLVGNWGPHGKGQFLGEGGGMGWRSGDAASSKITSKFLVYSYRKQLRVRMPRPACWRAKPKPSYAPANMATT